MIEPRDSPPQRPPYDSLTLRAVVGELRAALIGGQVQDVRQPAPTELRLIIRCHGRTRILALSCDARFARAHLTDQKSSNAATPPAFCMAVRKHCEGRFVADVRQVDFDRILEIEIGSRGGDAASGGPVLVVEMMGKHSNLILLSPDGVVLDAAKRISRRVNRVREVLPGVPYAPPPGQGERLDPFAPATQWLLAAELFPDPLPEHSSQPAAATAEHSDNGRLSDLAGGAASDHAAMAADAAEVARRLMERVQGMSPFLAQSIAVAARASRGSGPQRFAAAWAGTFGAAATGDFRPVAIRSGGRVIGAYPLPAAQIPAPAQEQVVDLNAALDAAYRDAIADSELTTAAAELRGQIQRERKRLQRQREAAEKTMREAGRADAYRQAGELLRASLWMVAPGAASVTVQDYFDPELRDREIVLDPKISPQENLDAIFRRYRKARDCSEVAEARLGGTAAQLAALDAALAELESIVREATGAPRGPLGGEDGGTEQAGDRVARIRNLREDLRGRGLLSDRPDAEAADAGPDLQGHKIRRVTTPEGYQILVGESATANDYLTTRLASPNDLWFHVRAAASAHVLVKTHGRPEAVPRAVIEAAAALCARHSGQKHSALVPVDYTLKKHVRKPRGSAPGSADYQRETTLHVEQ